LSFVQQLYGQIPQYETQCVMRAGSNIQQRGRELEA